MADQLFNIVQFAGLAVGVPTALPHNLNIGGVGQIPDKVTPDAGGLTIAADATNVTVTRPTAADPAAVNVLVEHWHSFLRVFGARDQFQPANLTPQPFFAAGGGGAGSNSFVRGNGSFTIDANQVAGIMVGQAEYATAGNPAELRMGSPYAGIDAGPISGLARTLGTGGQSSRIRQQAAGAFLFGHTTTPAYAAAHVQQIYSSGYAYGALGGGYVRNYGATAATSRIRVYGQGAFVLGNIAKSGAGTSEISGPYPSNFVMGRAFGAGTHTIYGGNSAVFVQGSVYGTGSSLLEAQQEAGFAHGIAANGATVRANGRASLAGGFSVGVGALIEAGAGATNGRGALAHGFASIGNGAAAQTSRLRSRARGAAVFGYSLTSVAAVAHVADIDTQTYAYGSLTAGYAYAAGTVASTARVRNEASGSLLVAGVSTTGAGGPTSEARTQAVGAFACGRLGGAGGHTLSAAGAGSVAGGYLDGATGVTVEATVQGAFARGDAASGYNIQATGRGSFAFGRADTEAIVASAANAAQWGPGTNALADSLKVGVAGLRLKGTTGAPGAPVDGDFWVAGGNVYVRSGGATQNLTNVP